MFEVKILFLKRIAVQGFKSFADKISLEFEQGIIAIVGPNGSGKSNVSDAIRWVLGEQSAKTLRGAKMEDIIFAGTESRKALNFAEVSIIMDNSDNSLPVDYSEVNITRRLFRSGDSEYYINKSSCRLKDVHELFMDTGVGRDGYSVIGQGRIDEILSSKSEDRRNIFEEASGIMKYKTRKGESERKLEATKQNLLRIDDIISELSMQIEPLREQSEKAKKHLELAGQLKNLDVNLFIINYNKLNEKLQIAKVQYAEIENALKEHNSKLIGVDESQGKLAVDNKNLENEILSINQSIFEVEKAIEKINADISVANEKNLNYQSNKERVFKENEGHKEKIVSFEIELEQRNLKHNQLLTLINEINSKVQEKDEELQKIIKKLDKSVDEIECLKSEIIERHNEISNRKSAVGNINVMYENIKGRRGQISQEIETINAERLLISEQRLKHENLVSEIKLKTENTLKQIEKDNKERIELERQQKENVIELDKLKSLISAKSSRHSLLRDMDREYEGFNKSVKSVLQSCERNSSLGKGVHGALVQLISVPKKYETAIDVALGGALQNIVTDDEDSAKKIIEYLKANNLGRATFLPISSVKARGFDALKSQLSGHSGVLGVGSDLIEFDKKYAGILGNLLGKVLVVDNISNAVSIAKKYNYSFKIVTLEGEVLNPGGAISGGSVNRTTNLISRSREIEELSKEIEGLNLKLEQLNKKQSEEIKKFEIIRLELEKLGVEQKNNELTIAAHEAELKQFKEQIEKIVERIRILEIEKNQLNEHEFQALGEIELLNSQIEETMAQIAGMSEESTLNQGKYKKDIELRDEITASLTEEKVKISGLNQEMLSAQENIDRINIEVNEIKLVIEDNNKMIEFLELEMSIQNEIINNKNNRLDEQGKSKQKYSESLETKSVQKAKSEAQIERLQKDWKDFNYALNAITDEKNKLEIKIAKLEMEFETLQNRIWDEYELTYNRCLELKQDISYMENPSKVISDIKSQINSLGSVNEAAIEEYVNVKKRHDFLTNQKADLEDAEKSLRKVINDMVAIMKKQFIEQLEIINHNFNEVFKELFGGGRAHLKLSNLEDVLECGIDIEAQPPGKKLQNLSLLSGGERALTAIAILFAMLKVRPTPFCVLDEIEAALDDANVYRFADYIKKFSSKTQFLIITHRKGTMEMADILYGVTMQEHGISRLVSVKLSEASQHVN